MVREHVMGVVVPFRKQRRVRAGPAAQRRVEGGRKV